MNPPDRWSDDRIQDLADELQVLRDLPMRVALLDQSLKTSGENIRECRDDMRHMAEKMEAMEAARQNRESEAIRERKKDRRWLIATFIAAAMMVIGAAGLFLNGVG